MAMASVTSWDSRPRIEGSKAQAPVAEPTTPSGRMPRAIVVATKGAGTVSRAIVVTTMGSGGRPGAVVVTAMGFRANASHLL